MKLEKGCRSKVMFGYFYLCYYEQKYMSFSLLFILKLGFLFENLELGLDVAGALGTCKK